MTSDEPAVPSTDHPPFMRRPDIHRFVMALMSPATTEDDVDRHTEVFRQAVDALYD